MKIMVLSSDGDSLINFRGHLIRAMLDAGHQVIAAAPDISSVLEAKLDQLGVTVRRFSLSRAGVNPIADLRTLLALICLIFDERPDLVFAYAIKPVIYGLIAAEICDVRQRVALITGLGYAFGNRSLKQRIAGIIGTILYRLSLLRAHMVFLQNPDDRNELISHGLICLRNSMTVNGSGVDLNHFSAPPPKNGVITFLLIARLLREKGIGEFVASARILRTEFPRARWCLIGPSDPNPDCIPMSEITAWQREGLIEYLGEVADVRPALFESSVYVLPSYYREGTPRTVLEAMACSRPIITCDMPGCRETVEAGVNGFLVPPRDPIALSLAMRKFLINPELILIMGGMSRQLAEEHYDVHKVNAKMLAAMNV